MSGGTYISSGLLTTSTAVYTGRRIIGGGCILTDGVNAAAVTVWDNATTNAGTVILKIQAAGPDRMTEITIPDGIRTKIGLYIQIEGTNAATIIYHK